MEPLISTRNVLFIKNVIYIVNFIRKAQNEIIYDHLCLPDENRKFTKKQCDILQLTTRQQSHMPSSRSKTFQRMTQLLNGIPCEVIYLVTDHPTSKA